MGFLSEDRVSGAPSCPMPTAFYLEILVLVERACMVHATMAR